MARPTNMGINSNQNYVFKSIKWILILFAVLNLLSSIWVGIYLEKAVDSAIDEIPDADGGFSQGDKRTSAKIWKGFIIAILVITDILNLIGIFVVYREHYIFTMIYGVFLMSYAIFCAGVYYTRGSVSSYLLPFLVGILAFVFAHKIREGEEQQTQKTVYKQPNNA